MENWTNLNSILSLSIQDVKIKEIESQKFIEFCQTGNKEEIVKLLKSGANINCYADNFTPLMACVEQDNYDLAVYLLKCNATISYKPEKLDEDVFWYALKNKKYKFLELFVFNRCLLSISQVEKKSPLIYSTINSDLKAVEILLSHFKIKVNEKDGLGNTALHYNVAKQEPSQDDVEIGRLLLAAGADSNTRNIEGKTPTEMAATHESQSILLENKLENALEEKPDDNINLEDKPNRTKNNKIKI